MVTSPLKKFNHSNPNSRDPSSASHSRQASSDARKNVQGQHPPPPIFQQQHQQQQQQQQNKQQNARVTSMDLARQYESDRANITKSCFSKRDPDGQFHESYITHVRIIEDSHYPSARPPADSNPSHKKHRILMIGVKRTGRVRLHKGRENKDGSVQIGRTWDLDELTKLEKDMVVSTGFLLFLGKAYYWETSTAREAVVFNTSVISTYIKYTSKLPELVGWDLKALGISPPPAPVAGSDNREASRGPPVSSSMPLPRGTPPSGAVQASNDRSNFPKPRQGSQASLKTAPTLPHAVSTTASDGQKRALQISPPSQTKFNPHKNAVLGASSGSLPDSRLPKLAQQTPSFQTPSPVTTRSGGDGSSSVTPISSGLNPTNDSLSSGGEKGANAVIRQSKRDFEQPSISSEVASSSNEAPLTKESTNNSLLKSLASNKGSVKDIAFNNNRASYIDIERETDSKNSDDDDEDDDGYDVTNYYADADADIDADRGLDDSEEVSATATATATATAIATAKIRSLEPAKPIDPRVAKYASSPIFSTTKSKEASAAIEELFTNIGWSATDDVSALEKKLMRQLVIAENESCQALINIGDDNAGLKKSLDASLAECEKLEPLVAFFNVELASFKDEINQINVKADVTGLNNRKSLYKQIVSMR